MPEDGEQKDVEGRPSKSQRKRDMQALRELGERLTHLPEDEIARLGDQHLVEAVIACKKITRGNARKRQVQYIGKLMRGTDIEEISALLDRFDAGSRAHVQQFHRLEQWRERLISEDESVVEEIAGRHPDVDRQHLRQLARNAIIERREAREPPVHFRRLFQFLRSLE